MPQDAVSRSDANQITRDYFDSLLVEMRHMDGVLPDTTLELFGERFATPVMMAALSHLNSCCEEGMAQMALGAKAAGAVNWAGMGERDELERICQTGARTIKIVKPYADDAEIISRLEHAERCGCMAVGMDIDHAFSGKGAYDVVLGLNMQPKSQAQMRRFVRATRLPFVVKGVLSVTDAKKSVDIGASAIVVSHHHGILPYAVPPLLVLPDIARAVGGDVRVFVDCGVESGLDVFKALALGADAVCAGRVVMEPLRREQAEGVRREVERITAELRGAMARTGSPDVRHIDPGVLHRRDF